MLGNFNLEKNHEIAYCLKNAIAREKISTDLESLEFLKKIWTYVSLNLKTLKLYRFLETTITFTGSIASFQCCFVASLVRLSKEH